MDPPVRLLGFDDRGWRGRDAERGRGGGGLLFKRGHWQRRGQERRASRWESGDSAYAQGVAVDRSGNLLFVSTESSRRVIRKFDPSGSLLWTQFLSETTSEHLGAFTGVAVDSTGNIVAVGRAGVAKFDAAGNELWNRIEPTNSSRLDGVAVDSSDSIVVTGSSAGLAAGIGESAAAAGELSPPPRRRAPQ